MSNDPPRLLTDEEREEESLALLNKQEARRRRAEAGEWMAFFSLLVGSSLVLAIAWAKTEWLLRRPTPFPVAIQYATTEERHLNYKLDFSDESGIPKAARRIPPSERRLPYMVVASSPGSAPFEASLNPVEKSLDLIVPLGVVPGDWSGVLRFQTPGGVTVASLPVAFQVADPWRLFKIGIAGFLLFTGTWYSALVYLRPVLSAWVLSEEVTRSERRTQPDPAKRRFQVGWWRRWVMLPVRHRVSLHEIDSRMPRGRLTRRRRGLSPGAKSTDLVLELDGVENLPIVQCSSWPKSSQNLQALGSNPPARIDIPVRGAFYGAQWCIVGPPDDSGNALAFSLLHPEAKQT
jgi:hypothetical protein